MRLFNVKYEGDNLTVNSIITAKQYIDVSVLEEIGRYYPHKLGITGNAETETNSKDIPIRWVMNIERYVYDEHGFGLGTEVCRVIFKVQSRKSLGLHINSKKADYSPYHNYVVCGEDWDIRVKPVNRREDLSSLKEYWYDTVRVILDDLEQEISKFDWEYDGLSWDLVCKD
jgi:hypothetical protein